MLRFAAHLLLAILAVMVFAEPLRSQERKLEPVDEAAKDASWTSFRRQLLAALEKRDRKFVVGILHGNVRNGSDSPRGVAEFQRQWHLDIDDSLFWRELASALSLGGAWLAREKMPRELCAPYVLAKWPPDMDPITNGVITAREALAKSGPSSDTQTLTTLSYHILPVIDWEVDDLNAAFKQKWVKLRLLDGKEGYVPEEQVRSPIEHAACFIKTEAGWRLTVFGPAGRD